MKPEKPKHKASCCASCGKPFVEHDGIQRTCAELQKWRECAHALALCLRSSMIASASKKSEAMKQYEGLIEKESKR